jgi:hypothetical protein
MVQVICRNLIQNGYNKKIIPLHVKLITPQQGFFTVYEQLVRGIKIERYTAQTER